MAWEIASRVRGACFRTKPFSFAKTCLLDRIEVGRIFRQEDEPGADVADGLSSGLSFVGAEIVEDHHISRLERGDEELFNVGCEALAIDRTVEQAGRVDAIVPESGEKGRRFPMAMRNLVDK